MCVSQRGVGRRVVDDKDVDVGAAFLIVEVVPRPHRSALKAKPREGKVVTRGALAIVQPVLFLEFGSICSAKRR